MRRRWTTSPPSDSLLYTSRVTPARWPPYGTCRPAAQARGRAAGQIPYATGLTVGTTWGRDQHGPPLDPTRKLHYDGRRRAARRRELPEVAPDARATLPAPWRNVRSTPDAQLYSLRTSATRLTGKHWAAPCVSSLLPRSRARVRCGVGVFPPTCSRPVSGVGLGLLVMQVPYRGLPAPALTCFFAPRSANVSMSCFHELRPRGSASRQCINPIASQPDSQLEKSWKTLRPRCQELGEVDRRIAVHAQSGCNELRHVQRPLQRNGIHSAVYASARPVSFEVQCHELLP